ncbi:MAG: mechanosensitive ion channel family protein [Nitrosomonadales bacterium]|nr:mechanosensitive ion channel family protein [Nitrosomonadales bacterium]
MSNLTELSPEIIRLLLVLAATIAAHVLARRALRHAESVAARTNNIWDDALIAAARKPLPVLIWLTGISFSLHLIHRQTGEQLLEYLAPVRNISVVLCIAWFLFALIREIADNVVAAHIRVGEEVDRTTVDGLSKVSRIIVLVVAALAVMQTMGFSISGVLAFGGMGGIAVGFAAKDLLANFFGGLMVHLDRPFNVGESIRSPDRQIEGRVEHIGWRQTIIRSPNMTPIYVPNSLFASIVVENPSRMSHRRIRETIGLRYDDLDKTVAIVEEVRSMLEAHPEIDTEQAVVVAFDQFADSSLNFVIQAFIKTTDLARFHAVKQDILLAVSHIIVRHGAEFAFPTRTLHLHQATA